MNSPINQEPMKRSIRGFPNIEVETHYPILVNMFNEQTEHLYCKFNDGYLKYRQVVIEWMIDVCQYFNLHITTTHSAICYLDRLQPNEKFTRFEWQIIAIACIIIASKYNEMEECVPPLKRVEEITQQEIPNDTFLYYELWALKRMGWKLNARCASFFICAQIDLGLFNFDQEMMYFKQQQKLNENLFFRDENKQIKLNDDLVTEMREKMYELAEKCLVDLRFKSLQASAIATAIIYYTRKSYNLYPLWKDDLTALTFHNPQDSRSTFKVLELLSQSENNEEDQEDDASESAEEEQEVEAETESDGESYDSEVVHTIVDKTPVKEVSNENQKPIITPVMDKTHQGNKAGEPSPISILDMMEQLNIA